MHDVALIPDTPEALEATHARLTRREPAGLEAAADGGICDRFVIKNEVTCGFAASARVLTFTASMHNRDT